MTSNTLHDIGRRIPSARSIVYSLISIAMGLLAWGSVLNLSAEGSLRVSIAVISLPILWIAWCIWRREMHPLILTGVVIVANGFLVFFVFLALMVIMFLFYAYTLS